MYINSIFSWQFTILPLLAKLRSLETAKVILAPRGMLHEGALKYKPLKKKLFLAAFKMARLHNKLVFQATDNTEQQDIWKVFGPATCIRLVQDFHSSTQPPIQNNPKKNRAN